jgi:hypothetical protein
MRDRRQSYNCETPTGFARTSAAPAVRARRSLRYEPAVSMISIVGGISGSRSIASSRSARGKGGKVVLVPLPPAVARAIDRAVEGRVDGPILRNLISGRMDRHAAHAPARTRGRRHRYPDAQNAHVESARSAVPVLPPARFAGPLAEPAVPIARQRALHGVCRQAVVRVGHGLGILLPR